jgi:regulatory protein
MAALRLLGRRDYTAAEIERRLLDRGYPADQVQSAIDGLRADGAIDDERAARAHLRTASTVKGRGRLRIRRELEARGIDRTTIEAVTADLSREDERAAVDRYVQRRTAGRPVDSAVRRRLYQQLIRRGYSGDVVRAVLHEIAGSAGPASD